MGGFRSPLFILGIAAASAPATQAGVRSLMAPWIGGASAPAEVGTQGGYHSLLAFWAGGAGAGAASPAVFPSVFPGGRPAGWREPEWIADLYTEERDLLDIVLILALSESCQ